MPQKPKYQLKPLFPDQEPLGARIARLRKSRGLTQTELGNIIGIRQVLVSDYERERLKLPAEMAIRIAHALEVSTDELFGLQQTHKGNYIPSRKILQLMEQVENLPARKQKALLENIAMYIKGVTTEKKTPVPSKSGSTTPS